MMQSPRLHALVQRFNTLAQRFNPKYNLAGELALAIGTAGLALNFVYLRGRPATTRWLRKLYAFTLFAQRIYPREATLALVADWLRFPLWLESAEPFSAIQPLIEREEKLSQRADMVATATQHLLMNGRTTEARAANRLWCEITGAWWQQTRPLTRPKSLFYTLMHAWFKASADHDLDVSRSRGREALAEDLAKLNRQEKQLLQGDRKLPRATRPRLSEADFSGALAKSYRHAHLLRALLEWSAQHDDKPLAQLRAQSQPGRVGMRYYLTPPPIHTAALIGMNREHYLSLVKKLTQEVRRETAAHDPVGTPLAAPSE